MSFEKKERKKERKTERKIGRRIKFDAFAYIILFPCPPIYPACMSGRSRIRMSGRIRMSVLIADLIADDLISLQACL
jgi:hypothetical protein